MAESNERPRAETWSVQELVRDAWRGRLRVPSFQRRLKWDADDVAMLLDSLRQGYPIGALLLWKGRPDTPGEEVRVGEVRVDHPSTAEPPLWIVDGQQRVSALALALTQRGEGDPRYRIWFDPDTLTFHPEPRSGPEPIWFPVHQLLVAAALQEYLYDWEPGTPERRRAILETAANIRDFRLPVYVVTSESEAPLRVMFQRANQQGKRMEESEVFDALVHSGARTIDVQKVVADEGWGLLENATILSAATVDAGKDPTRKGDLGALSDVVGARAPMLRDGLMAAIRFLRDEAHIPALSFLPYQVPLIVLPAFFARHPRPSARNRRLLRRWVWRSFFLANSPKHLRDAARAIVLDNAGEDRVVQRLLALAPSHQGSPWSIEPHTRGRRDSAQYRLGLLGLASLAPSRLEDSRRIEDVDVVTEVSTAPALPKLVAESHGLWRPTLANHVLPPPIRGLANLLATASSEVAARHAADDATCAALRAGDLDAALAARARAIERATRALIDSAAEWGAEDRPSIRAIFVA